MSKSLSNRLYLKKDLYQLRMDEGSDLGDHILEFNRLVSQLSSIDVKLEEEDQAILLLSSLPKSYKTLKTTLLIGKKTLLVDDVMSALMDLSRVNGMRSSSQGEGLVVRSENKNGHGRGICRSRSRNPGHGKYRSKSRGKQDKSNIGHIARKCPKRKEKKNGKKHVNNANVAEKDDKSSDGDLYWFSRLSSNKQWVATELWRKEPHDLTSVMAIVERLEDFKQGERPRSPRHKRAKDGGDGRSKSGLPNATNDERSGDEGRCRHHKEEEKHEGSRKRGDSCDHKAHVGPRGGCFYCAGLHYIRDCPHKGKMIAFLEKHKCSKGNSSNSNVEAHMGALQMLPLEKDIFMKA
ncbi:hypothetical protein RJ640_012429 [Escallonia rubra]|uniref:Retrovirus-related Pol polyprotein from transposon TNT 1-94 n=1 Tax=Escallonia rubra TaxID=112253 RepID=A0AA88QTC2_9ASTE|nr:hypothetical protein RJ640_012429 [Escallonia rubra]